mmetsp:Transcript_4638/g.6469  ORF Transcript_4638/g.6469 Transcript_4638/m.6469 type:complete len:90 (-) Transcript_4638:33-302(-)
MESSTLPDSLNTCFSEVRGWDEAAGVVDTGAEAAVYILCKAANLCAASTRRAAASAISRSAAFKLSLCLITTIIDTSYEEENEVKDCGQ